MLQNINISKLWDRYGSFVKYIAIGFTGLALDMLTFVTLIRVFHLNEQIVNPISMSVGITNNFFLNAYFNFKKTDNLIQRFGSFYAVGLVGIAFSNLFLFLFNDFFGGAVSAVLSFFHPLLAQHRLELVKSASIVIIAIMQYFLNKKLSFADKVTERKFNNKADTKAK